MNIIDLDTAVDVWSGSVTKTNSDTHSYDLPIKNTAYEVMDFLDMIKYEKLFPFPPDPTLRDTIRPIFQGFAENMPQREK